MIFIVLASGDFSQHGNAAPPREVPEDSAARVSLPSVEHSNSRLNQDLS